MLDKTGQSPVIVRRDGAIVWLIFNRPEALNAIDRDLGLAVNAAFREAEQDDSVRAIVVTGTGRAFCSGDDIEGLKAFLNRDYTHPRAAVDPSDRASLYLRLTAMMTRCPKPVIAAINGFSFGAGTEIACAADIRCMSSTAQIGSKLVNIAQIGNAAYLSRVIGLSRAFEIFVTGRALDADEARDIGLVHYVYLEDDFEQSVAELAEKLANGPTKVIAMQKRLLNDCEGKDPNARLALQEAAHQICFFEAEDAEEGARAFFEKRAPDFKGK
ncbi:MAG: enoyl-CoA hydratase-related protein [Pseudomonadota bacterium]